MKYTFISSISFWILCSCGFWDSPSPQKIPTHLHFLSVGQGLAVLLEQEGSYALFDTGPDAAGLSDTLKKRGIDSLEWIIFSHWHQDHCGGFYDLEKDIRQNKLHIRRIFYSADRETSPHGDSILHLSQIHQIPVKELRQFDTLYWDHSRTFKVLWPPPYGNRKGNAASIVLHASDSKYSVLLTADLETPEEKEMLSTFPNLKTTLLQAGHHGSYTSTSFEFLSQIQPELAVISSGKGNSYGHPTPETLQKLNLVLGNLNQVFRTDIQGSVSFTWLSGTGFWKKPY